MAEGSSFSGRARVVSMTRILAFSGGPLDAESWPARNLHTDTAKATEAGLAAPIASGVQCEGDVIRLMLDLFGDAWFRHGRMQVKYPRPVLAGMTIQAHARVTAHRPGENGTLVELEVRCEADDGTLVAVGTASCIE